ncbi:hypothetical protein AAES_163298 [Amazona aestiva]|uniref:Uncharacterized protein n=1 Tax=Amazona aestiva TaxID=12930 RepID=A0A0Q3LU02_AMAAE|nr:hypothetical protein AAES_163298 [Amazona aestiva]
MILWFLYPQFKPGSLVVKKKEKKDEGQIDRTDMGSVSTSERTGEYVIIMCYEGYAQMLPQLGQQRYSLAALALQ